MLEKITSGIKIQAWRMVMGQPNSIPDVITPSQGAQLDAQQANAPDIISADQAKGLDNNQARAGNTVASSPEAAISQGTYVDPVAQRAQGNQWQAGEGLQDSTTQTSPLLQ